MWKHLWKQKRPTFQLWVIIRSSVNCSGQFHSNSEVERNSDWAIWPFRPKSSWALMVNKFNSMSGFSIGVGAMHLPWLTVTITWEPSIRWPIEWSISLFSEIESSPRSWIKFLDKRYPSTSGIICQQSLRICWFPWERHF